MSLNLTEINFPNNTVVEEHNYFSRDGKNLFYAEFMPKSEPSAGLVLCGPFAEERVRTIRIYVSFARALASMGTAVICFDYYGDGDSEGAFGDASFNDRIADINGIYRYFREKHALHKTGLLGLRWGGTLATYAAESVSPEALILWEPVIDTSEYFYNHLRSHLASQMLIEKKIIKDRDQLVSDLKAGQTIMVEGYDLTGEFYIKASESGLKDKSSGYKGDVLVVQIGPNVSSIRPELTALADCYPNSEVVAVPREFEWSKTETWQPAPPDLFNKTFNFLDTHGFFRRDI